MTYHVYRFENAVEDHSSFQNFQGNKPALPPLTTESVESIIYVVDEEPTKN
ncbi:MAG TPA: hypothetical protein VL949_02795 [Geobacteraceae bacterium]|nr:hypothetical protein [Geobacteraceae bacterium]